MKIQCNVCELAEATVLCCADEAALCVDCDQKIHTANKLAGKHQRVPLTRASSSHIPKCDICQDASGYFFCMEDRALLCRKCDIAIHSVNDLVSAHQRFLLTGVKVGIESTEPIISFLEQQTSPTPDYNESLSNSLSRKGSSLPMPKEITQSGKNADLLGSKPLYTGGTMSSNSPGWPLDEFFRFTDYSQHCGFTDHGSSKADSGSIGSMEDSPTYRSASEERGMHCLGVPDMQVMVPEIPSTPTASGMHQMKNYRHQLIEDSAFVPDICFGLQDHLRQGQRSSPPHRRRRLL